LSKNSAEADVSTINFACPLYAGIESDLIVVLEVERHASSVSALNCKESVRWSTQDDTAKSGVDYKGASGVVYFEPGKVSSTIEIELIKKEDFSADRRFRVLLHDPDAEKTLVRPHPAPLPGLRSAGVSGDDHFTYAEVVIINVDDPGILSFADERMRVNESSGHAVITVLRSEGCSGTVTCRYWTQDGTAVSPADYEATEGELIFLPGEMWKQFEVAIVEDEAYENDETFLVHITDATGGARFDATTDGSVESCICEVKIISDEKVIKATDRLMASLNINKDLIKRNYVAWGEQFVDALKVSDDDEFAEAEGEEVPKPSCGVYVMHFLSLPWKLVFALVPPTEFLSGWTCFFCSLIGIGCLTLVVGELASVIGCLLKIEDAITAITFVALGTSLPDTLASKAAAKADPYADASIGNVTGSNSVNVFLGLGLPWLIASIYWTAKGERSMTKEQMEELSIDIEDGVSKLDKFGESGFYVPSGNLTFSVVVFCCCGLTCIAFLQIRRMVFGGELGGPYVFKVLSSMFLVMLWFVYIVFSVLQIEGIAF
jgi:solute carrier family 8 (sodium/calcium exchanger)